MYVYIQPEPRLWTVGFYDPTGKWHPSSDHNSKAEAADMVKQMNGEKNYSTKPKCRITNGEFSWFIEVDGKTYSFVSPNLPDHLKEIYEKAGYEVEFISEPPSVS